MPQGIDTKESDRQAKILAGLNLDNALDRTRLARIMVEPIRKPRFWPPMSCHECALENLDGCRFTSTADGDCKVPKGTIYVHDEKPV
jgi:hypothetical protein